MLTFIFRRPLVKSMDFARRPHVKGVLTVRSGDFMLYNKYIEKNTFFDEIFFPLYFCFIDTSYGITIPDF